MIKEITAMDARRNFGEILNEVKYCHDSFLITKAGKPIAAMIDTDMFEKIRKLRAQFDTLTSELGQAYQSVELSEAEQEIEEAMKKDKN